MLCARFWLFLGCALLVAAAHPPSLAHADELDDFVAAKVQECKELTRKRDELASQAAQKGNALSPDARLALERLNTVAEAAQNLLRAGPPRTAAEKEDYARKLSAAVGEGALVTRSVQRGLGQNPFGVLERRLDGLQGQLDKYKTKYGAFDNQPAHNPTTADINIARKRDNDFFSVSREAAGANAGAVVAGAVRPTSESDARAIARRDGSWGGGVMLEGTATVPWSYPNVGYSSELNALLFDDRGVYFLKAPPWITATLCRAIAGQKNQLVGVSLTGREGLVFGRREIYQNSTLARDLMLADQFLADIVFGDVRWTNGYRFPDGYHPSHARIDRDLAVRFSFKDFQFVVTGEEIRSTGGSLEVRFAPLSAEKAGDGGLEPDYRALRDGYQPPAEFVTNANGLIGNLTYFRNEKLVARIFDYGETAALLRGLENAHADLNVLADTIERNAKIRPHQIALGGENIKERLEKYWIEYLTGLQSQGDYANWRSAPLDHYVAFKAEEERKRAEAEKQNGKVLATIQEALIWTGDYNGMIDNNIGQGTTNAIRSFQRTLGQQASGVLTDEQAQALVAKAVRIKKEMNFTIVRDDRAQLSLGIPKAYIQSIRPTNRGYHMQGDRKSTRLNSSH